MSNSIWLPRTEQPQELVEPALQGARFLNSGASPYFDAALRHAIYSTASPTVAATPAGVAAAFNGSTQFLAVDSFEYLPEFTFIAYLYLGNTTTASSSIYYAIASHHTTSGVLSDWYLYRQNADGKLHVDVPWGVADAVVGNKVLTANNLHLIALTRTGSTGAWTYKLYVDGALDASATTATNQATTVQRLNISCFDKNAAAGNAAFTNNKMLYSGIISRALSGGEIAEIALQKWSVYVPRRIWVPVSGGGATTGAVPIIGRGPGMALAGNGGGLAGNAGAAA